MNQELLFGDNDIRADFEDTIAQRADLGPTEVDGLFQEPKSGLWKTLVHSFVTIC